MWAFYSETALSLWWMTDVTKLLPTTVKENTLNLRTAYFQYRQEGIKLQIEDKGKPMSSLSTD